MLIVGSETAAAPVARREMVSPSVVKPIFVLTVAIDVVGANRTFTAWLAPSPTRVNGLPATTLNGGEADALPLIVPPRVFCTVKILSAKLPTFTLPKYTLDVGLTEKSSCATALAPIEQALSTPPMFSAVTET